MKLRNAVGELAQEAVNTAVSVVRHPISTASMAAGLVKGTAGASVGFVRAVVRGEDPVTNPDEHPENDPVQDTAEKAEDKVDVPTQREGTEAGSEPAQPASTEPVDLPREPEVVPKPVPEIDELPEPIVIEADDSPGEAFHTEPKAASRDSEHGGSPGDREEAEGYLEEIPSDLAGETAEDPVVWTSESTDAPEPADVNRPI